MSELRVEISTVQANVRASSPYASVLRRLVAYGGDCGLAFVGVVATQALLYPVNLARTHPSAWVVQLWVFATVTIPIWLFFAWRESVAGATPVAARLGLRVTTLDAASISLGRALARNAVKLIPFELNHAVLLRGSEAPARESFFPTGIAVVWLLVAIYIAAAIWTKRRQSVHDIVARTLVVSTSRRDHQ